jgi:hypothetical protein
MRATRIISEADIVPNRAAGYRLVQGRIKNQEWVAPTLNTTADGSLYFSINDLTRWAVSLNQGRIPSRRALHAIWTPVRLHDGGLFPYGFGWNLVGQRGHRRIGHGGAWQGFKTAIYRYPEFHLTVIVLANLAQAEPGAIAEGVAGILEPALLPPHLFSAGLGGPSPPVPMPQLLARITGRSDSNATTPGLARFLSATARKEIREQLRSVTSWTALGCETLARRGITWLAASIRRVCYLRAASPTDHIVVSVFYAGDWRAAYLDISRY